MNNLSKIIYNCSKLKTEGYFVTNVHNKEKTRLWCPITFNHVTLCS